MWHHALPLDKREQSLLSIQGSSHHPPRRLVFSSLQQPFLIWPTLGWHIPEPKCTHKLLSLVASSLLLSDSYQGRLGILNWITLTRKKSCGILFQHHLASEMLVSTLLPSEATSPFLLSRGSPACSHPSSSSCKYWLMFLETEYHHSQGKSCITD